MLKLFPKIVTALNAAADKFIQQGVLSLSAHVPTDPMAGTKSWSERQKLFESYFDGFNTSKMQV